MAQKILSIHTGHDASISYWEDYEQKYIFKEERLNRIKNWGKAFPELSFEKINDLVSISDVDVLLLSRGFYPAKYFKENVSRGIRKIVKKIAGKTEDNISIGMALRQNSQSNEFEVFDIAKFLKDYGFRFDTHVVFCDHHIAHALPTLFYKPSWDNALLYTSDGGGDGINYSVTYFNNNKLKIIYGGNDKLLKNSTPDSLGQMYGITTEICGFKKNRHEGKITGLAAFGKPICANLIVQQYDVNKNGLIIPKFNSYSELETVLQNIFNEHGREVLAASSQLALEILTVDSIKTILDLNKASNIGLSGGVCSNVKLNQHISEIKGIDDVFVFPPMTDEGLVVGYVLKYLLDRDGLELWLGKRRELSDMYWGEGLSVKPEEIPKGLNILTQSNITEHAVDFLLNNKICALFSKQMEYGPRALGARSILINPSDRTINDTVNKRLDRTEFMPFAPYVMEDMVGDVFEVTKSNKNAMKFMTITTYVKDEWKEKIQATVHIDGTARPQTINRKQNELYYDILKLFFEKTGVPCLVNTSFNAHEEPIINTPEEAFFALLNDRVDCLIFENMIVTK
jgi:carbamoyltransferase